MFSLFFNLLHVTQLVLDMKRIKLQRNNDLKIYAQAYITMYLEIWLRSFAKYSISKVCVFLANPTAHPKLLDYCFSDKSAHSKEKSTPPLLILVSASPGQSTVQPKQDHRNFVLCFQHLTERNKTLLFGVLLTNHLSTVLILLQICLWMMIQVHVVKRKRIEERIGLLI